MDRLKYSVSNSRALSEWREGLQHYASVEYNMIYFNLSNGALQLWTQHIQSVMYLSKQRQ